MDVGFRDLVCSFSNDSSLTLWMQIRLCVASTNEEWGILVPRGLPYIRFALSHCLSVPQFGQLLRDLANRTL